jgi:[ribosomal protein S18]-alanine N-acetyltransferase
MEGQVSSAAENAQVRPMAVADLVQVLEIAAGLPDAPHWPQSAYIKALDPAASPRRIALVAVGSSSAVSGFAAASLVPPQAELETIAVAAEFQRQGLGRRLFDALVDELREAGVREVVLEVRAGNRTAHSFYRSLGFGEVGMRRAYYTEPVDDAVLMRLRLGQM